MKNNVWCILAISVFSFTQSGCHKFLSRDLDTNLSQPDVIHSYDYSKELLTSIYSDLSEGLSFVDGIRIANATDDAEFTFVNADIQKFNLGVWNAFDNPDDVWGKYYKAIRKVNQFLKYTDSVNLDPYKLDPSNNSQKVYNERVDEIHRWNYEARFLRAFFYFQLVKRYGGVPLLSDPISLEDNYKDIKRNTLEECVDFIANECDSAAAYLPLQYDGVNTGRATKGAALSLKSIVLLYAASDLFSDPSWAGGYPHPELISLSGNRQAKWDSAAKAAKAVIDLNVYSLSSSYSELFGSNSFNSNGIIFIRRDYSSNFFEKINYPIGFDLAEGGTTPSQNLVDAYEMKDGSEFDWSIPNEAATPYEGRDPRLMMTVVTNNSIFKDREVEIWKGGLDGEGIPHATKTGYYLKKYVNDNLDLLQGKTSVHSWIFIRLAEIYMNYAEALNEFDPGNPDIRLYIDKVRERVGMPDLPPGLSQSEMRQRIQHEDRVEFAFEGHRFWDLRRWMQASKYLSDSLRGVQVTKTSDNQFNYKEVNIEKRVFEPKMYLYPIPQSELNIASGLAQNPVW